MHAGLMPLLQGASLIHADWGFESGITVPLLVLGAWYARGALALRSRSTHAPRASAVAAFAIGWSTLVVALVSPLHGLSEQLFSAHMIQHELLMALAAPLLVAARPGPALLWALGPSPRGILIGVIRARAVRGAWHGVTAPFAAWLIQGIVIWGWHAPPLFQATLHSELVHAAQHISFVGSAVLFWWSIVNCRRSARGLAILSLFTTAVHTGVLGALMSFAHTPWYPDYASRVAAWGLSPLDDQQLAGLIMWIPASAAYLFAALTTAHRWLRDSEFDVTQRERAAFVPVVR
ncbi:MAG TPA: cytochrome c oxidase assembly protein [Gemmatimonadaceae bacterium]|nr:cytochrome c oxidase assembly protein [Gemmatimonadaceae bacterium]